MRNGSIGAVLRFATGAHVLPVALVLVLGCGSKAGAFPAGCPVEISKNAPSVPVTNIGPVSASCDAYVSDEDCLRTLKDQACELGADVVWGVDAPTLDLGKKVWNGRAAKRK